MGWLLGLVTGAIGLLSKWLGARERAQNIEAGRAQQREATTEKVDKEVEKARAVENRIDAAGDDELERMRDKWTRPSATPSRTE